LAVVERDYVKRNDVSGLTGIFKAEEQPVQDTDKLVDLFRNRSELKKEFAALRDEKYRLEDRIKEHRGAIERVQQKLNHLEALLLDPEWVHNVVTFYQLRRLSAHCEARLERFAEQLKQQREKRIQDKSLAKWREKLDGQRSRVEARLGEHRQQMQMLEEQLQTERDKMEAMGGLSKLMNGKSQAACIESIETSLTEAQAREAELLGELERIDSAEPPPHEGLDIAAKRSINCMILSFAQQLYLDFYEDNLATLAKEASDKSVGAVNYGGKLDCDEILERLAERREEVERREPDSETLQERARLIAKSAEFRSADEAVPTSGSVATVFDIMVNGAISRIDTNLLGENYFKVARVLSR
jgi:chromosome segregation ATPase